MVPDEPDPAHDATLAYAKVDKPRDTVVSSLPSAGTPGAQQLSLSDYQMGVVLGRGGMGEVVLAHDKQIGRDVALKQLRGAHPSADVTARFLREARIQARLEHPAIVPVHQVGVDEGGRPYFTMKRLTGRTLFEMLGTANEPPRTRLLDIFIDVCQAIELAHARGVVHRDVKPSNIMAGDFGEVYVLDWGLARLVGGEDEDMRGMGEFVQSLDGATQSGAMLGTPGFMAPEQVEDASTVGPPADVYALGAVLFEMLAGEPLHPRGNGAIASTVRDEIEGPAVRRPDRQVPPELDQLCRAALLLDPAKRPTVKQLFDGVKGFLNGDRDTEARRVSSRMWLERAKAALHSGDVLRRAEAMNAAGYALVLDRESEEAASIVQQIVLEPPPTLPPELAEELGSAELAAQRRQGRVAMGSFVAVLLLVALVMTAGVRSWPFAIFLCGYTVLHAAVVWMITQRPSTPRRMWLAAVSNAILCMLLSRLFGPLLIAPSVGCIMAISMTSYPHLIEHKWRVIGLLLAAWLGPVAFEVFGLITPSWSIEGDSLRLTSAVVSLGGRHTVAVLFASNMLGIMVAGLFASALAISRKAAMRQTEIQAWHLRQLLPTTRDLRR